MPAKRGRASTRKASLPGSGAPGRGPRAKPHHPLYKIAVEPHVAWARALARVVRVDAGFLGGTSQERDLESVALLWLCIQAMKFDPARVRPGGSAEDRDQLFRNWSRQTILTQCARAADKLREGGMYRLPLDREKRKLLRPGTLPRPACSGPTRRHGPEANCDTTVSRDVRLDLVRKTMSEDEVIEFELIEVKPLAVVEKVRIPQPEALAEALVVAARQE